MRALLGVPVGRVAVLLAAALLIGCASGPDPRTMLDTPAIGRDGVLASHRIFVATTREPAESRGELYSGRRAEQLGFARVDVTVPSAHRSGELEQPRNGARRDASRHFAAGEMGVFGTEADFVRELRSSIASTGGRALVFVHGYRTPFANSVFRAGQIVHDSGYSGTPVLFSWASSGRTIDYVYDNNSATIARDGLERLLDLVRMAGATRVDIVAHSMGNWVTMEALRQLAISRDRDLGNTLGDVVLAAPDIDVDVFKSQMRRIGKPDRPFFVLLSRDDRALLLSGIIAGNRPRVGDYGDGDALASLGIIVVNVSALKAGDGLNHAKFADNPLLVRLLGERLSEDDQLGATGDDVTHRIERLVQGLGTTVGTAAEIIITTPLEVINVAVGQ